MIFTSLRLLARCLTAEKRCPVLAGRNWDNLTSLSHRTDLLIRNNLSLWKVLLQMTQKHTRRPSLTVCVMMLLHVQITAQSCYRGWPYHTPAPYSALVRGQTFPQTFLQLTFFLQQSLCSWQTHHAFHVMSFPLDTDWIFRLRFLSSFLIPLIPLCIVLYSFSVLQSRAASGKQSCFVYFLSWVINESWATPLPSATSISPPFVRH